LSPILERRLGESPFAGLTEELCLNSYREAYQMRFVNGRLADVRALGFRDRGGFRLPPRTVAPLLLGYRSRDELAQAHHDVSIGRQWQHLIDVLFPKTNAFIYTRY
jgi:hypothetical protein